MLFAKLGLTRKALFAGLSLAALASGAFLATTTPASASPQIGKCGTEIDYYSDSTFRTEVGVMGWLPTTCGCQSYRSGTISAFKKILSSAC
jgi:hypothetical protein